MSEWLMHYAKGATKKNHKWVKREAKGNKWKYWYILSQAPADALNTIPLTAKKSDVKEAKNELDDVIKSESEKQKEWVADERRKQKEWNEQYDAEKKAKKAARREALFEKVNKVATDVATKVISDIKDIAWLIKFESSKNINTINSDNEKAGKAFLKHGGLDMGDELYHHGILGMRWGIRRFQNADGSLTSAGQKRYGFAGGDKHPSKGISKKEVKKLVDDYNKVNGTRFKYGKDTVVTKGQYTYDYKGNRLKTGQEVSSTNKWVDKASRINPKKQKSIEELQEEVVRRELETKLKELDDRSMSTGKKFITNVAMGASQALGGTLVNIAANELNSGINASYERKRNVFNTNLQTAAERERIYQKNEANFMDSMRRKEAGLDTKGGMSKDDVDDLIKKRLKEMGYA